MSSTPYQTPALSASDISSVSVPLTSSASPSDGDLLKLYISACSSVTPTAANGFPDIILGRLSAFHSSAVGGLRPSYLISPSPVSLFSITSDINLPTSDSDVIIGGCWLGSPILLRFISSSVIPKSSKPTPDPL